MGIIDQCLVQENPKPLTQQFDFVVKNTECYVHGAHIAWNIGQTSTLTDPMFLIKINLN